MSIIDINLLKSKFKKKMSMLFYCFLNELKPRIQTIPSKYRYDSPHGVCTKCHLIPMKVLQNVQIVYELKPQISSNSIKCCASKPN